MRHSASMSYNDNNVRMDCIFMGTVSSLVASDEGNLPVDSRDIGPIIRILDDFFVDGGWFKPAVMWRRLWTVLVV